MRFLRVLRPTLLDRYVMRETFPPTLLGLVLFTFLLLLQDITRVTGILISRGADFPTIVRIFLNIMPSILAITIPMAFLLGVLLAFGRLASDSEIVALRASGVSPARLLRPVVALALVTGGATFYVMAEALPAANQQYREILYSLVLSKARTGMRARVFTDDLLPGLVLYISDIKADDGEWKDVFIHDGRNPQRRQVILARTGHLVIDKKRKLVEMHLDQGVIHSFDTPHPEGPYTWERFKTADLPLPFEQLFPQLPLAKGDREMTLSELAEQIRVQSQKGQWLLAAPFAVEWHKKFAIPSACLVFGILGLGLSLGSKKEARSAAFGLSIAIIFVYYVLIKLGEQAGDTGRLAPWFGMWAANLILGAAAVALLVLNHREAAFDPLDPSHYRLWLPRMRRAQGARPGALPRHPLAVVVRVRVPRLDLAFARILDRYVARAYVQHMVLVVAGFWAIFLLAHFIEMFEDIQQHHAKGAVVLHFYAFYTPAILHLIIPIAALVTPLITFGILSRRNEITAMKAGGISLYRATLPVLGLGALASFVLFAMGEFILPPSNRVADADYNVIKGRPAQSWNPSERRWIVGSDNRLYNYDYMVEEDRRRELATVYGLSVYDINREKWDLRDRLFATQARWNRVSYELDQGWRRSFGERTAFRPFDAIRTRDLEPPSYFRHEERASDTLSFGDLQAHIASLEALGLDVIKLKVQLQRKVAFPMVGLVMTLIGIPFAFVVGRRGALYGIGISIIIAIVYWACLGIFEALGANALLPPVLAAWAPNLLFGATGLYLMFTLET